MNIPNLISLSRIFLLPFFLYLLFQPERTLKFAALVVFGIAALTDFFDGWSARKLKQESELGKFLDPFADKVLVITTLIAFLMLDRLIPLWMIIVIVARDILVTVLRYAGIRKGMSIRTSRFGKIKTAFQMISILIIIMIFAIQGPVKKIAAKLTDDELLRFKHAFNLITSGEINTVLLAAPYWLMFIVTILTAWSGVRYLVFNWKVLIPPYKSGKTK
jgi:cardiolipin synthase (CMP-forming)